MEKAPATSVSTQPSPPVAESAGRTTLHTLREKKKRREPIAMLTAYDFPSAKILSAAGVDLLLVGDSAATVLLGEKSTTAATLDFLLILTAAVRRGAPDVFLMADMPIASYPDIPTAVANASRFVREAGADCVKFEMDIRHAEMTRALSAAGICVCAHVGLLPQRALLQGGYIAQGRTPAEAQRITDTAVALVQAGAHLLLLEAVPDEVTAAIQRQVDCPVLGCGAGPSADGHVLVLHDMLGFGAHVPRFVQRFADIPAQIENAARQYMDAVRSRTYPAAHHQYRMKTDRPAE